MKYEGLLRPEYRKKKERDGGMEAFQRPACLIYFHIKPHKEFFQRCLINLLFLEKL